MARHITTDLPDWPCILVAESFSGCLIPSILQGAGDRIVGVIFVASFVSCPQRFIVRLVAQMPLFLLRQRFLSAMVVSKLFLNACDNTQILNSCLDTILWVPSNILKARLRLMTRLQLTLEVASIPAVYIRASKDRVIRPHHAQQIGQIFSTRMLTVDGPHFVLQANPEEGALKIRDAVTIILERFHGAV